MFSLFSWWQTVCLSLKLRNLPTPPATAPTRNHSAVFPSASISALVPSLLFTVQLKLNSPNIAEGPTVCHALCEIRWVWKMRVVPTLPPLPCNSGQPTLPQHTEWYWSGSLFPTLAWKFLGDRDWCVQLYLFLSWRNTGTAQYLVHRRQSINSAE